MSSVRCGMRCERDEIDLRTWRSGRVDAGRGFSCMRTSLRNQEWWWHGKIEGHSALDIAACRSLPT